MHKDEVNAWYESCDGLHKAVSCEKKIKMVKSEQKFEQEVKKLSLAEVNQRI